MSISPEIIDFLNQLKQNNNKEWFTTNKSLYEKAKADFEVFIKDLFGEIAQFDPEIGHHDPKSCIFRIYRDVRFSKDKSPYKTHFGAHITLAAKKSDIHTRSGYYIHIETGNQSMLAGGDYNGADLEKILLDKNFKAVFGEIEGEKLQKVPKDFDPAHPQAELLKMKSFLATHQVNDSELSSPDFLQKAVNVFKTLKPLGDFLNRN